MYLSQVRISGFKSFLEKTNIELRKNQITIIVGPNGCGKSNIFDAVRWTIGESSGKLRVDTGDNIIFAGSENSAAVNLSQVHLHFINDEEKDISKYGKMHEFQISRKLFRDGNNQYYINQRSCRLLDIKTLLMDLGVSYSGYSFIEQGNVTQIIHSKPSEKRQIIEEVAGLMKYKTLKRETENRLNNTEHNLVRIEDKRLGLESQESKLAKQASIVEDYLQIKGRIEFLRKMLLAVQWQQINCELKDAINKKEKFLGDFTKEKLVTLENDITLLAKQLLEKQQQFQNLQNNYQKISQVVQKLENQWQMDNKLFSQSHAWIEKMNEEKSSIQKQLKQKTKELEKIKPEKFPQEIIKNEVKNWQDKVTKLQEKFQISIQEIKLLEKELQETTLKIIKNTSFLEFKYQNKTKKDSDIELKNLQNKIETQKIAEKNTEQNYLKNKKLITTYEENILKLEKQIKQNLTTQKKLQIKTTECKTSNLQIKQNLYYQEELIKKINPLKNFTFSKDKTGFLGFVGELLHLKKDAPRSFFHLLDGFLHTAIFTSSKKLEVIFNQLEESSINYLDMIFLDKLPKDSFTNKNLEKEFIFHQILDKEQIEKICAFFRLLKNDINFGKNFSNSDIFYFSPCLLYYKKTSQETSSEKYTQYNQNIANIKKEFSQKEKQLITLEQEYQQLEKNSDELEKQLIDTKERKNQIQKISNNLHQIHWQAQTNTQQTKYQLEKMIQEVEQKNTLEKNREKVRRNLQKLEQKKKQVLEKIHALKKKSTKLEQGLNQEKKILQEKENNWQSYQLQKQFHTKTTTQLQEEITYLQTSIKEKRNSIIQWQQKIQTEETLEKIAEKIKIQKEQKQRSFEQIEQIRKQVFVLEKKRKSLDQQKIELQKKIQEIDKLYYKSEININLLSERQKSFEDQLQENYSTSAESFLRLFSEKNFQINSAKKELENLQKRMPFFSNVNLGAKEEYKEVKKNLDFYNQQKKDLETSVLALREAIVEIEKNSKDIFLHTFEQINNNFKELFDLVFQGGKASLSLQNENDILNSGVEIYAQPQGKKLQTLSVLSGGEKSLVGLVFIFAVLKLQPNIFCFLDEVDAALDTINVRRITTIIKEIAKYNQIIIVTHNQQTMLIGDVVLGVTMMDEGISRLFSVDLQKQTEQIKNFTQ